MTNVHSTITHFSDFSDTVSVPFPRVQEWETSQRVQVNREAWHGSDYGADLWGRAASPVQPASERLRIMAEHEEIDLIRARLQRIGRGTLWMRHHDGSLRWAWARISEMPSFQIQSEYIEYTPIIIEFVRYSDWYSQFSEFSQSTITSSPTFVNVSNNGLSITRNIIFTLVSNEFAGWNAPTIENTTTAEQFTINRTGSTGMQARLNVMGYRLEHSMDGLTWTDDTDRLILGGTQANVMTFPPEQVSSLRITGCSNATVTIQYYHAWR